MFEFLVMRWWTSWNKKQVLNKMVKMKSKKVDILSGLTGCLCSNTLKDIVDERVKNRHRLVGDTGIGVNLFKD